MPIEKLPHKEPVAYQEHYKKGVYITDKELLIHYLQQPNTLVEISAAGAYSDKDREFLKITIHNITPLEK